MAKTDYSDTLRVIGRFLEEQGATEIKIVDAGDHFAVSWKGEQGHQEDRNYRSFELDDLRDKARLLRHRDDHTPALMTSEILRVLGWALDQMGAQLNLIAEGPDGLKVSTTIGDRAATRTYSHADLEQLAQAQRQARQPGQQPLTARSIAPIPQE
jgi:hypothetical protein